MYDET